MGKGIFRKKSIERVASPEALNDYVRVANPSIWIVLGAIIILLAGVCVWGVFGRLDTRMPVGVICNDNKARCFIKEDDVSKIKAGMRIVINDEEGVIGDISDRPKQLLNEDAYFLHITGYENGQWVYEADCDVTLSDGVYEATIITDSVSPISFVMN